ncbi:hydroxylase [Pilimelia anulata]|uniref:Hydroxylase n=1 Tax=Pilimelia anulata TaxID=53371 RepID=A0A8J3AYC0_9ACTN|nr:VOC family protein [Pilimelia anulata]GGJ74605.1 hydroxylase [Pilimelia anulata]
MTNTYAPGTPSWIELGTTDIAGAKEFYHGTLGWTFEEIGPEAHGYLLVRSHGQLVGGLGQATDAARGTSWVVYFAVDDAEEAAGRADGAGGKVVVGAMDVLDKGRMAVLQDPAGAYFSVWQPTGLAGAERVNADGGLCWAELMTSDIAAAKRFYGETLGLSPRDISAEGVDYTLFEVGGTAVAGGSGIRADQGDIPPHWSVYIAVDDCDATADRAIALGATEALRETAPPGRMAIMHDPQGGKFCIITPDPTFTP